MKIPLGWCLAMVSVALVLGALRAQETVLKNQIPIPTDIEVVLNLDYAIFEQRAVQLDLYRPKAPGVFPGVVLVHGGGWFQGSRHTFQAMAIELAQRGYVVANIDYRLATEAIFPAGVEDTKAAVRWLRAHAATYQVDPRRIGGIGGSAGGHLIALASTVGQSKLFAGSGNLPDVSAELQATIILGGEVDLVTSAKQFLPKQSENYVRYLGGPYPEKTDVYASASPINHVHKGMGPFLMIDAEFDRPGERYVDFRAALDKLEVPNAFIMVPGAKHGQWNQMPFRAHYVEAFDGFFKRHLKVAIP